MMELAVNNVKSQGLILAQSIGEKAWKALLEEVYTTPKPGLVDLYSCGAHTDMNVSTFEKSAKALYPYFIQMAVLGYELNVSPEELFKNIRLVGIKAEKAMFQATNGVNTHKGLLFTLGVFCAASGRCIKEYGEIIEDKLFHIQQQMTTKALTAELWKLQGKQPNSHGEENLKKYGLTGIRGEAIKGYPSIRNIAIPVLREGIAKKKDWNLVKIQTLFHLMSEVEDSNIISRKNPKVLYEVQKEAKEFLNQGGAYEENAIEKLYLMDKDYICKNISAGGCADLLATGIFIELLLNNQSEFMEV